MIIQSSTVSMNSNRYFLSQVSKTQTRNLSTDNMQSYVNKLSTKSSNVQSLRQSRHSMSLRNQVLNYLFALLFGGKEQPIDSVGSSFSSSRQSYSAVTYSEEEESTSFSTEGKVVTSDGRELSFNIDLTMSRHFTSYLVEKTDFDQQQLSYCDPLVLNLETDTATVSDQKFYFDLDGDGEKEHISQLNSKSGYLALDKNQDGIINDGTELFGTKSGNGFQDLSAYDIDKNGWIDEADEVFQKLKVYRQDSSGNQILCSLKEAGVGAICLQSVHTDFSLKSARSNEENARIRQTGIFLYETGGVGTMQHLDLVK